MTKKKFTKSRRSGLLDANGRPLDPEDPVKLVSAVGVHERHIDKLRKRQIRPQDVEPCVNCKQPADPAIQGYDKKWRCMPCNRLHHQAVLRESGKSAPNAGEVAAPKIALPKGVDAARRAAMIARARASIKGNEGDPNYRRQVEAFNEHGYDPLKGESEEQRRARIIKKYSSHRKEV